MTTHEPGTTTRYVATHICPDGHRTLSRPRQGRETYDTAKAAQAWIDGMLKVTARDTIVQVWGKQALGTFAVRPVQCVVMHGTGAVGDPVTCWFD